ncbi:hypothetical protein E2C01_042774 [Portunus trituberculatus]|uniref:Uncharacterized protein n=1 Tax=Portunus trituberculatus TaxID=210409 RepID=A0A5B7FUB0_PORTR|nr:hypothetical protein [Portunus trituberculatus]
MRRQGGGEKAAGTGVRLMSRLVNFGGSVLGRLFQIPRGGVIADWLALVGTCVIAKDCFSSPQHRQACIAHSIAFLKPFRLCYSNADIKSSVASGD